MLGASAAWDRLRSVRTETEARAAGLVRGAGGPWRWREEEGASSAAQELAGRYLPLCLAGPRLTFAQLGQSLDGFIASRTGDADYVTGEEDRAHLHRMRALADAVLVGAGTAAADDPRLTVRACSGAHPVRVVLDPHRRVRPGLRVFTDGAAPTLWVVGPAGDGGGPGEERRSPAGDAEEPADGGEAGAGAAGDGAPDGGARGLAEGVEVLVLPDRAAFAPRNLVRTLARRGLGRVLVEGGGVTVSRFLHEDALDRLYVTVAPVLLGDGVPGLRFPGPERMRDALRPPVRRARLGVDTLFELDLRAAQPGTPADEEHQHTGQAGGEAEQPVHHRDGQPLGSAQP
ncbi:RibD family protein [Streptomyces zingiberis]|uniref:RibD family protein n=1 Tax=Streptomyces zingiberis TaxID=2053010 RepID=UPI0028930348|nr:RibD family protein [Streptomyces zingiberis]